MGTCYFSSSVLLLAVEIGALQAKDLSMTDIARLVKQNVKTHNATPQEALEKTFAAMQEKVVAYEVSVSCSFVLWKNLIMHSVRSLS